MKETKEITKMRTRIYAVYNKTTEEKVYFNCRVSECEKFINKQENKENLVIISKCFSF